MKATIAAVGMCVCFIGMASFGIWLGFERDAEKQRADAAEIRAEKLSIGQDFLAEVVKYVKENCADKLSTCKQEAVMELPCYPNCSAEKPREDANVPEYKMGLELRLAENLWVDADQKGESCVAQAGGTLTIAGGIKDRWWRMQYASPYPAEVGGTLCPDGILVRVPLEELRTAIER